MNFLEQANEIKKDLISSLSYHGVLKTAEDYLEKGWQVKANIQNWAIPDKIHNYIPDIVAKKDNITHIVMINTCLSLSDRMDQKSFLQSYAHRTPDTKYLLLIVDRDLKIKTEKEFDPLLTSE